jgi:hypothetical protein
LREESREKHARAAADQTNKKEPRGSRGSFSARRL